MYFLFGHAPRGRVSWNDSFYFLCAILYVTPLVGVWVEMSEMSDKFERLDGHVWVEIR